MASLRITFVALAFLGIAILSKTLATGYVVGDMAGWDYGVDYQAWATGKQFKVGDKLIFKYEAGFHHVVIVDQNSFQACVAPAGARTLKSSNDIVELKSPGTFFYICDVSRHCDDGPQKLSFNVSA